jgi:GTP-binding protein Era
VDTSLIIRLAIVVAAALVLGYVFVAYVRRDRHKTQHMLDHFLGVIDDARVGRSPWGYERMVGSLDGSAVKIDLIPDKQVLLETIALWSRYHPFEAVVPISALDGTQVEAIVSAIVKALPAGPAYYPEETLTDVTERFIASELIREKLFRLTGEEIPYASAVTVEAYKPSANGKRLSIEATIHLERDSQKGIVIGKGGAVLKRIGTEARQDIERMTGAKVYLKLFVRVEKNWRKDSKAIERFGY